MDTTVRKSGDTDKEMGERVRAMRLRVGMTQTELGTALGVSFQQVQRYERGVNRLSIGMFIAVCRTLKVDPMDLLGHYFSEGTV
ncbi:hypothetical protein AS026_00460 [Rhizobium altiplani]|uniref:HTH cro/C1-type domain-containing protein n=1 Tax=Rhizobium altiplani TaxID=1864509 RepID=A0A109K416_9HYPH|nr:helix-turn-helix transcriptional regulator [Rhizobium altiplani]KWV60310.1 hypothetical protein AS026_00460 [Rhizobium altiplani]